MKRAIRLAVGAALRDGNLSRACRFATPKGRIRVMVGFSWFDKHDYRSCEEALRAQIRDPLSRWIVSALRRRVLIPRVQIHGDQARATVGYRGRYGSDTTWVKLRLIAGQWRVGDSGWVPPIHACGCGG